MFPYSFVILSCFFNLVYKVFPTSLGGKRFDLVNVKLRRIISGMAGFKWLEESVSISWICFPQGWFHSQGYTPCTGLANPPGICIFIGIDFPKEKSRILSLKCSWIPQNNLLNNQSCFICTKNWNRHCSWLWNLVEFMN